MPAKRDAPNHETRAARQQASRERAKERAKTERKAQAAAKRAARAKLARESVEYAAKMAAVLKAASKTAAAAKRETPKEYAARYYREVIKPRNEAAKAARTESDLARIAENRSRAGSLAYANRKDRGNVPAPKPKPLKPAARIDWEALGIPTVHVHSYAARDNYAASDDSPAASHWFKATRLTHKET